MVVNMKICMVFWDDIVYLGGQVPFYQTTWHRIPEDHNLPTNK
jgi:hypothetical protein